MVTKVVINIRTQQNQKEKHSGRSAADKQKSRRKGKHKSNTSFYTLTSANNTQRQKIKCCKYVDHPFPVLGIHTGNGRISSHTLHHDYFHSYFTSSAEKITSTACTSSSSPFRHLSAYGPNLLLSYTGSIFLQIILKGFLQLCFSKVCPVRTTNSVFPPG